MIEIERVEEKLGGKVTGGPRPVVEMPGTTYPEYFIMRGHDVTHAAMVIRVHDHLMKTRHVKWAKELMVSEALCRQPLERTHYSTGDLEWEVTVLNVTRDPHPMTLKVEPEHELALEATLFGA